MGRKKKGAGEKRVRGECELTKRRMKKCDERKRGGKREG